MQQEELKEKNSNLSVLLIVVNVILIMIFFNLTPSSGDESMMGIYFAGVAFVVLLGIYAFSYGYRAAKWFFGISFMILLIFTGLLWYAFQLGKAFQH
ncbi:hypothetical protein [Pedobacter xixiisoli]|uniref:Uncharacterized protein n=1 Tax=Pedobacter xixiisoli TaxID=1476464 RepID=A0A285ZPF2_9SPHI|nr:hypothetical protein [Pedobacter xixiisoli]SOD11522.1 hypothetical protein SAMN06297358_0192 [Pedobacter xixiisoli]